MSWTAGRRTSTDQGIGNHSLLCQLELSVREPDENENIFCEPFDESGLPLVGTYVLRSLPTTLVDYVTEQFRLDQEVFVVIPGGTLSADSVIVPSPDEIRIIDLPPPVLHQRRKLRKPPSFGSLRTAMIRVSTVDSSPTYSAEELRQYLYEADPCPRLQFERCSNNQLTLLEPEFGVVDVTVNTQVGGKSPQALANLGEAEANKILDADYGIPSIRGWTHVLMVVLPSGTGSWTAYAVVNGKLSVFNDRWGASLGALMHELGHNLGLRHSYENGVEYGGVTGYMGLQSDDTGEPQKCYNPHDHYKLGWFEPQKLDIPTGTSGNRLVTFAAFVDYDRIRHADEHVVVRIGDLYAQYNRATRHNFETEEYGNELTIVQGKSRGETDLLGGLALGEKQSFLFNGLQINIEVCEINGGGGVDPDTMTVSIGVSEETTCVVTASPSFRPTRSPSHKPTFPPTVRPTPEPSQHPTPKPVTASPSKAPTTDRPSRAPTTSEPSRKPTLPPTVRPTPEPSRPPTPTPVTASPSKMPATDNPSRQPTFPPTVRPTPRPSQHPTLKPVTASPSKAPTTDRPSRAPTTSEPSRKPTLPPSVRPTPEPSRGPTPTPVTVSPSKTPATDNPSCEPTFPPSVSPTPGPSQHPTPMPVTASPSKASITDKPSRAPTTSESSHRPTVVPSARPTPVTASPSKMPTTDSPSREPTTSEPSRKTTSSPSTGEPSKHPTPEMATASPSTTPTTDRPTQSQTVGAPSRAPNEPSLAPSIRKPSQAPSPTSASTRPAPITSSPSPQPTSPRLPAHSTRPSSPPTPGPSPHPESAHPSSPTSTNRPSDAKPLPAPASAHPSLNPTDLHSASPTDTSSAPTRHQPSSAPTSKELSPAPTDQPSLSNTSKPSPTATSGHPSVSPSLRSSVPTIRSETTSSPPSAKQRPSSAPTTAQPSLTPTKPSAVPTSEFSVSPTTDQSSSKKTEQPSSLTAPTTSEPTMQARPSSAPSESSAPVPTNSFAPSAAPTTSGTSYLGPSLVPSGTPTTAPGTSSIGPSLTPTMPHLPTRAPSSQPPSTGGEHGPSFLPSVPPSAASPTISPASAPTPAPTITTPTPNPFPQSNQTTEQPSASSSEPSASPNNLHIKLPTGAPSFPLATPSDSPTEIVFESTQASSILNPPSKSAHQMEAWVVLLVCLISLLVATAVACGIWYWRREKQRFAQHKKIKTPTASHPLEKQSTMMTTSFDSSTIGTSFSKSFEKGYSLTTSDLGHAGLRKDDGDHHSDVFSLGIQSSHRSRQYNLSQPPRGLHNRDVLRENPDDDDDLVRPTDFHQDSGEGETMIEPIQPLTLDVIKAPEDATKLEGSPHDEGIRDEGGDLSTSHFCLI